ncbi:hypothetical protein [uncultured Adlercreutzia sp.]|uniref:hypothetical protein n=1 Tax=uncultured Adlercreutzia sp. TaxID=875803 RepID=UPI00266DA086|nr:hypothetical protein [uncultured Adlercreutzia sp.]
MQRLIASKTNDAFDFKKGRWTFLPKKLCRQTSLSKLPGKHIYTPKENEKPDKTFFVKDEVLAYPVILAYAVILASVCRISAYAEIFPFKKTLVS